MNDKIAADVLLTILKIICLGTVSFMLIRWQRAKRAGRNSFFPAWPFAFMIAALIIAQAIIWLRGLGKPGGWIGLSVAGLLAIAGGVGLLRQTWRMDKKA